MPRCNTLLPVFSNVLLLAAWAHGASVAGIIDPSDVASSTAGAEDDGPQQSCQVLLKPYAIWGSPDNPALAKAPTANPPPQYVYGALDFQILNTGTSDIPVPFNVSIHNAKYSQTLQVWNVNQTSFANGTMQGYVNASYGTLQAKAKNSYDAGFIVKSTSDAMTPTNFSINAIPCKVFLVNNITGPYLPFEVNNGSIAGSESAEQPLSYDSNGNFLDVHGNPITLKCANYFGFNNGATMFDGLYAGSSALTQDFALVLQRIQLLGINCLRVPFSFQTLWRVAPGSKAVSCNPASQADVRANVIPPGTRVPSSVKMPGLAYPEKNDPSICNQNVPNDSVYHRFLYILQVIARNNLYVMIDDHSEDSSYVDSPSQWPGMWAALVKDIVADRYTANRVFVDLINEPDHANYNWQSVGPMYLAAMEAIYAVAPKMLMAIEGCGQLAIPGLNWGDGFATKPEVVQRYGLSDATSFFQQLSGKPYVGNVVISPHIYPPTVSFATSGYAGEELYYRLYNSFGYLKTEGFYGHKFAILVGEIGSKFEDARDIQSLNDMSAWFQAKPNTGAAHSPVQDLCFWSWNANSGDTGGLVDGDTWTQIQWKKIAWMQQATGLKPWYKVATGAAKPTPSSPVAKSPPAKAPAKPTPKPPAKKPASPPPAKKPAPPPAKPAAASGFKCKASTVTVQPWGYSGAYQNTVSVNILNTGTSAVAQPYTITVASSKYQKLAQYWGWDAVLKAGGKVVGTIKGGNLTPGQTVNVGFVIQQATNDNFSPSSILVNNQKCL